MLLPAGPPPPGSPGTSQTRTVLSSEADSSQRQSEESVRLEMRSVWPLNRRTRRSACGGERAERVRMGAGVWAGVRGGGSRRSQAWRRLGHRLCLKLKAPLGPPAAP